ncbi:hypothetical protein AMTR_s00132p00118240 [Amborella trichopoda]|uniref:Uncharacterized protein n=1 Tax=Amborella trichopoda TaxID=13333 RepID=W1NDP2_AMBTC|nr:hypothetical protein AMTR_s00132p00118240 [Amborella trichopoda]
MQIHTAHRCCDYRWLAVAGAGSPDGDLRPDKTNFVCLRLGFSAARPHILLFPDIAVRCKQMPKTGRGASTFGLPILP